MWMPEYLGNEGNRLLKLIEEPPPNTLFILVAENQEQILATILSRTHLIRVNPLPKEVLVDALVNRSKAASQKQGRLLPLPWAITARP